MKFLTKFIFYSLIVFTISFFHILVYNFFSFPFYLINIIFLTSILFMIWYESGLVVWFSFFCHLILEFFSSSFFGILIFSGTMSILISFWLYKYIFTNRSWYATLVLSFFSLSFFRFFYVASKISTDFILKQEIVGVDFYDFSNIFWETILTCLAVSASYGILFRFYKKFNPTSLY